MLLNPTYTFLYGGLEWSYISSVTAFLSLINCISNAVFQPSFTHKSSQVALTCTHTQSNFKTSHHHLSKAIYILLGVSWAPLCPHCMRCVRGKYTQHVQWGQRRARSERSWWVTAPRKAIILLPACSDSNKTLHDKTNPKRSITQESKYFKIC